MTRFRLSVLLVEMTEGLVDLGNIAAEGEDMELSSLLVRFVAGEAITPEGVTATTKNGIRFQFFRNLLRVFLPGKSEAASEWKRPETASPKSPVI